MQIEPRELAEKLAPGEPFNLLDVRTREEFDAVKLPGAQSFHPGIHAGNSGQLVARKPARDL